jgi:predicted small secreted protein
MTKRIIAAIAAIAALFVLAGCNTMEGLGKDVKKSGEAIEKAADRNK